LQATHFEQSILSWSFTQTGANGRDVLLSDLLEFKFLCPLTAFNLAEKEKASRKRKRAGPDDEFPSSRQPQSSTEQAKEKKEKKTEKHSLPDKKTVQRNNRLHYFGFRIQVGMKSGSVFRLPWKTVEDQGCPLHVKSLVAYFPKEFTLSKLIFDEDDVVVDLGPARSGKTPGSRSHASTRVGPMLERTPSDFRVPRTVRVVAAQTQGGRHAVYTAVDSESFIVYLGILPQVKWESIVVEPGERNTVLFSGAVGPLVGAEDEERFGESWSSVGEALSNEDIWRIVVDTPGPLESCIVEDLSNGLLRYEFKRQKPSPFQVTYGK
jgi:hypothetical protein